MTYDDFAAQDVLNLNITSVLLNLYETTTVKWTEDYYKDTYVTTKSANGSQSFTMHLCKIIIEI